MRFVVLACQRHRNSSINTLQTTYYIEKARL